MNEQSLLDKLIDAMSKYVITPEKIKTRQHHCGDLLEHSKWSALQIIKWYDSKSPYVEGLYRSRKTAIYGALLHDICKAGDCSFTCKKGTCWLDIYSKMKYDQKDHSYHPDYCGDILLGLRPFYFICPNESELKQFNILPTIKQKLVAIDNWRKQNPKRSEKLDVNALCKTLKINQSVLALMAYMHWEFGKLNTSRNINIACKSYLHKFLQSCKKVGLSPTIHLLKLCILISLADISGAYPVENSCATYEENIICNLGKNKNMKQKYPCFNPYIQYGLDKNGYILRQMLLNQAKMTLFNNK